jgi:hypothetical protein
MSKNDKIQYWQRIFQQQTESELTKAECCKTSDLTLSTFYAWAKNLTRIRHPLSKKWCL